eukprot:CAMPEP_0114591504 /NCGR_PEP_ID=MMETSP0125-20121206/13534_1 /TAXON_ID=485358 ORGANISM="Aristerostoma sp., Strain ATCC 50986" /NCGR_SAMPLE_ID=MMETSP0125 /ASSEMBLY_ACC=CAM_ASM_000245 /LENGTH=410 /DNA_ID=CAMNT_0001789621 /DNA_START=3937 /DNA_END=5170 /DNA_ORIENTATION=-
MRDPDSIKVKQEKIPNIFVKTVAIEVTIKVSVLSPQTLWGLMAVIENNIEKKKTNGVVAMGKVAIKRNHQIRGANPQKSLQMVEEAGGTQTNPPLILLREAGALMKRPKLEAPPHLGETMILVAQHGEHQNLEILGENQSPQMLGENPNPQILGALVAKLMKEMVLALPGVARITPKRKEMVVVTVEGPASNAVRKATFLGNVQMLQLNPNQKVAVVVEHVLNVVKKATFLENVQMLQHNQSQVEVVEPVLNVDKKGIFQESAQILALVVVEKELALIVVRKIILSEIAHTPAKRDETSQGVEATKKGVLELGVITQALEETILVGVEKEKAQDGVNPSKVVVGATPHLLLEELGVAHHQMTRLQILEVVAGATLQLTIIPQMMAGELVDKPRLIQMMAGVVKLNTRPSL